MSTERYDSMLRKVKNVKRFDRARRSANSLDDVMERHIFSVVEFVQLVAHVLEQQAVFLRVNFESPFQQPQYELDPPNGNHAALVDVDDVPGVLEVADVGVGQQRVFFVGVEQRKVLHDNSCVDGNR